MERYAQEQHWLGKSPLAVAATLFIATTLLYSLNIGKAIRPDELYHVLAARGLLETGAPRIAEGLYERGYYYTAMLSKLFEWFGESITVARIPSILSVSALVSMLYLWLNKNAGNVAALLGALLFGLSPFAIEVALFIRFYSFQAAFFFIGSILCYAIVYRENNRWLLIPPAVAALGVAVYLQKTSMIGIAGIGLWLTVVCYKKYDKPLTTTQRSVALVAICLIAGIGLLIGATGILEKIWGQIRYVPLWNSSLANAFWYYLALYLKNYPTLTPLLALITLAAIIHRPRPALFCLTIVGVSLTVSSIAASKGERYIIYAQPFFFGLIGIGLTSTESLLVPWLTQLKKQLAAALPLSPKSSGRLSTAILASTLCFAIIANPGFARSAARLSNGTPTIDWKAANEFIKPWLDNSSIVLTLAELEMLYHFGKYDLLYSPSRLEENGVGSEDFDADFRTGKPVIGKLASIKSVIQCNPDGLLTTGKNRWNNPTFMPLEVKQYIIKHSVLVDIPTKTQVVAYRWDATTKAQHQADTSNFDQSTCSSLPIMGKARTTGS